MDRIGEAVEVALGEYYEPAHGTYNGAMRAALQHRGDSRGGEGWV